MRLVEMYMWWLNVCWNHADGLMMSWHYVWHLEISVCQRVITLVLSAVGRLPPSRRCECDTILLISARVQQQAEFVSVMLINACSCISQRLSWSRFTSLGNTAQLWHNCYYLHFPMLPASHVFVSCSQASLVIAEHYRLFYGRHCSC